MEALLKTVENENFPHKSIMLFDPIKTPGNRNKGEKSSVIKGRDRHRYEDDIISQSLQEGC